MNETLTTIDGRSVLRLERRLPHPQAKVWRAVTDPAQLSQWFPATISFDGNLAVGAKVGFDRGQGTPSWDGVVTDLQPPDAIGFTWGDDELHMRLSAEGAACRLVFTHTFGDRAGAASFASGWERCLDALGQVVDGRPADVPPPSGELHEEYVRRFHLTEGSVDETPEGWTVRFERQLTRPAATAWAVLIGASAGRGGAPTVGEAPPERAVAPSVVPGPVTAVDVPTLLEYAWHDGGTEVGRIRWELGHAGTGHGARLVVVQTGPSGLTAARDAALTGWAAPIDALATELLATDP